MFLTCDLALLPGQKIYTKKLPVSFQTYSLYAGVFTTGIGNVVDWRVDVDLYWKCRKVVQMAQLGLLCLTLINIAFEFFLDFYVNNLF